MKLKIISGGQTGVDRSALDSAIELEILSGGWCPKGRLAEDSPIDKRYPLKETESSDYDVRTEWNVRDSHATLIITRGIPTGGTAYTIAMAKKYKKPCLIIDMDQTDDVAERICSWLKENNIQTLNIAGPRESNFPGIYNDAKKIIRAFLNILMPR